jgi:CheY-like chemotaxis protein
MMQHTACGDPWKVLIVDDDSDVHDITQMALHRLLYEDRPLAFYHAYSAAEALGQLRANPGIAVALLDVVMETETSGLDLVKIIREDMGNTNIRIVVCTGNPGMAPEESVTMNYDINDYRGKTELSAQSLRTVMVTRYAPTSPSSPFMDSNKSWTRHSGN